MDFLDKIACRFLIWRLRVFKQEYCLTQDDWKDGMVYADGGCFQCKANLAAAFLESYVELSEP